MSVLRELATSLEQNGIDHVLRRSPHYLKARTERTIQDTKQYLTNRSYNPYGILDRDKLKRRCAKVDSLWYYGSETTVEISPPVTGDPSPEFQTLVGSHTAAPSFVCHLEDVQLFGVYGFCRTDDGKYVLEEMGTEGQLYDRLQRYFDDASLRERIRTVTSRESPSDPAYDVLLNLVPRHGIGDSVNYAHWLTEDLPRLRAYDPYCEATGVEPTLLVPNDPPSWMVESLELLGFPPSTWIEWDGSDVTVSRLVIPQLHYTHSSDVEYHPADRNWVSERIKANVDPSPATEFPDRVFISRQGADKRQVINFTEVMDTLQEFGFEAVRMEELSFSDQVRLSEQAEIMVGPHGAGLTNMLFATDASVVEIHPYGTTNILFHVLANENDLEYDYIHGEHVTGLEAHKQSDIAVDTETLRNTIRNLL